MDFDLSLLYVLIDLLMAIVCPFIGFAFSYRCSKTSFFSSVVLLSSFRHSTVSIKNLHLIIKISILFFYAVYQAAKVLYMICKQVFCMQVLL
jgi:hypothetical protein